jgi:acetyltransferase
VSALSRRGVRFSKVISFGNGRDVDAAELLDYAASDAATRTVIAYVEDVTNGRALFEALRACARAKPTVVLKGGVSEAGARAARSHSASLAGGREVFEAMCRQAGAALVGTLEELEDLVVALKTGVRNVRGPRAILLGLGGGFSVITSDALARHGIDLPELAPETIEELLEVVSLVGNSVRNPLDVGYFGNEPGEELRAVLRIAAHAPGVDFFLTTMGAAAGPVPTGVPGGSATGEQHTRRAIEAVAELQASSGRPIASANRGHGFGASLSEDLRRFAYERGVGIFESVTRAGRAVELLLQWRVSREGLPPLF